MRLNDEKFKLKLKKFLTDFTTDSGVKAIYWGGSSQDGTLCEFSDVDIFIITDNSVRKKHGRRVINNVQVEFFVNPMDRIYSQMNDEITWIHDYWTIKIYAFSKIIYDAEGEGIKLQLKAKELFNQPFGPNDEKRDIQNYSNAYDAYFKYLNAYSKHQQWRISYYECLKALLNAHCYHFGLPIVPWYKAEELLSCEQSRKKYHLKKAPEKIFCSRFLECLKEENPETLKRNIATLFEYSFSNVKYEMDKMTIVY